MTSVRIGVPYRVLSLRATWAIHIALGLVLIAGLVAADQTGERAFYALPAAIVIGEIVVWFVLQARAARIVERLREVSAAVKGERYVKAAQVLDELARASRWIPNLHALLGYKRFEVHVAAGEPAEAEVLGRALLASGWMSRPGLAQLNGPLRRALDQIARQNRMPA